MRPAKKEMTGGSTRVTRSRGLSVDESQDAKGDSGVTRSKRRNQTRGELAFYFDSLLLYLQCFCLARIAGFCFRFPNLVFQGFV